MGIERDEAILAKELSRSDEWQRLEQECQPHRHRTREEYWASRASGRDLSDTPKTATTKRRGVGFNPWFPASPRRRQAKRQGGNDV